MKIPAKFKIEGRQWSVKFKWRIELHGKECYGLCLGETREIWLQHGLGKEEVFQIFMHEYLHAVLFEKGLYVAGLSTELEEIIVHGLAKELCNNFTLKIKDTMRK